jgi:hypothetical protein
MTYFNTLFKYSSGENGGNHRQPQSAHWNPERDSNRPSLNTHVHSYHSVRMPNMFLEQTLNQG